MEKSHLVSLLRSFDKKELRELKKWMDSPAHNQRQDVRDLLEYLTAGQRLLTGGPLAKEKVFERLFPGRPYHDADMRQAMFFLFKALENFLLYHEVQKDEVRAQTMLAKVYRERQLPKLFQKTVDSVKKIQDSQPYRSHLFYENEYLLQFEQYAQLSGLSRTVPLNLQEVSNAYDVSYFTNKLRLSCIMLSHQTVFKTEYQKGPLPALLQHIEVHKELLHIPAIALYYFSYKAITDKPEKAHYFKIKEHILANGHLFPPEELRVIYLLTLNYCIGKMNAGDADFVKEAFTLYKQGFERNIFLENGIISRFTFGNAVMIALTLKEYNWVKNFITDFSIHLDEKYRENHVHFYLARLHFEQGDYPKAMTLFVQADYIDLLMTLVAKTMLLKMYYELDEFYALESLLESMRTYLQRKKVMGYHKSNYQNILRFTKKLLRATPFNKAQIEKLRLEIEAANPLTERHWLLTQLEKF